MAPCRVTASWNRRMAAAWVQPRRGRATFSGSAADPAAVVVTLSHLSSPTAGPTTTSSVESTQLGATTEGGLVKKEKQIPLDVTAGAASPPLGTV